MSMRTAEIRRCTNETEITVDLILDGARNIEIKTGLGFLDHMITSLAFYAGWDLKLDCRGDLEVDDHHTVEDCALTLGQALEGALGERGGIARFGSAYAPLDEALARAVVDLSGRPWPQIDLGFKRETLGAVASENLVHFFVSLTQTLRAAVHIDVLRGSNDHHRAEAAFKAFGLALSQATALTSDLQIPSTKGSL